MEHHTNIPITATRLTIASILLTTVMVNALPMLPYGQDTVRDFPSSSSAVSGADESSGSQGSLKEDIAALEGLSPEDAYLLALSLLVDNGNSLHARSGLHRASAPSRGNIFEKRGSKRFDFGFSGLDTVDHILSTMNSPRRVNSDLERIKMLMQKAG